MIYTLHFKHRSKQIEIRISKWFMYESGALKFSQYFESLLPDYKFQYLTIRKGTK